MQTQLSAADIIISTRGLRHRHGKDAPVSLIKETCVFWFYNEDKLTRKTSFRYNFISKLQRVFQSTKVHWISKLPYKILWMAINLIWP